MWLKLGLLFINLPSLLASSSSFVRREGRISRKFTKLTFFERCGTGTGIQCTSGSGMEKIRIRDKHSGSYFLELCNNSWI
jgi:hypothetical protein